jgi:hypothetical protein
MQDEVLTEDLIDRPRLFEPLTGPDFTEMAGPSVSSMLLSAFKSRKTLLWLNRYAILINNSPFAE